MSRSVAILSAALALGLLSTSANAQSVAQLKAELAAEEAQVAKLKKRVRELERGPPTLIQPVPVVAPVAVRAVPLPPSSPADDEEAERALERTLVREGALVLAPFTYEVTPQASVAHWDKVQDPFVRNSYSAALSARMGLPWDMQVSVSLPYVFDELRNGDSNSGLADAGFLISKELMRESEYGTNLVGSVGWTSPTQNGSAFNPIPYVSGFQGGLTASKRFDPLVVFGSVSYFSSVAQDVTGTLVNPVAGTQVNPSDVIGSRFGGSLAISPATSVTMGLNMSYLVNPRPIDLVVPQSDQLLSTVDVGFATVVGPRTLLSVTAQFGVTGHVPDFRLIAALPIRF
jgi:hypothetical protein